MPSPEHLKHAAKELLKSGRPEEAIVCLRRALSAVEQAEDAIQIEILQGAIHLVRREYREALWRFDDALEVDPANEEARNWRVSAVRGLCSQECGDRRTELYLVSRVGGYRRLAEELPDRSDLVIELGASTGRTTRVLAASARRVVAVEKTAEMFARAKEEVTAFDNVLMVQADAWDMPRVLVSVDRADLVFVDIGGSAAPWQTMGLAKQYIRTVRPRGLVLRNTELNEFVASLTSFEEDGGARWG